MVVGLDPSLTGFAVTLLGLDDLAYESRLFKSQLRGVARLHDITLFISSTLSDISSQGFEIVDVGIEDSVVHSHSAVALGELHGTTRMYFYENFSGSSQFPLRVPPTMVKKFATDRGNAKKNEVLLSVYKKYGVEFTDDNLADSYVIARIVGQVCNTGYEKDILTKLEDPKFRDHNDF